MTWFSTSWDDLNRIIRKKNSVFQKDKKIYLDYDRVSLELWHGKF